VCVLSTIEQILEEFRAQIELIFQGSDYIVKLVDSQLQSHSYLTILLTFSFPALTSFD